MSRSASDPTKSCARRRSSMDSHMGKILQDHARRCGTGRQSFRRQGRSAARDLERRPPQRPERGLRPAGTAVGGRARRQGWRRVEPASRRARTTDGRWSPTARNTPVRPIPNAVTAKEGFESPVYYWDPVIAPSGAEFYTGSAFPAWRGNLFVGALKEKRLVRLVIADGKVTGEEHLLDRSRQAHPRRQAGPRRRPLHRHRRAGGRGVEDQHRRM